MDPMEVDTTHSAASTSPTQQTSHALSARPPPERPSLIPTKRVSFEVPPRPEDPKRQRAPPPPPVQQYDAATLSATPTPPSLSLLPSIFLPFHGVPTPSSSTPLTRESTLVKTIDNLALQKKATKRLQIYLALQERDRSIVTERAKAGATEEGEAREASRDVTGEEMDAIQSRLAARPDPKKSYKEFEYRGGEWIRDPAEREKWKRAKGEELGHGVAEKVVALVAEAAVKMKMYELQSNSVVEGKKRALESERKRMGALEGTGGEEAAQLG